MINKSLVIYALAYIGMIALAVIAIEKSHAYTSLIMFLMVSVYSYETMKIFKREGYGVRVKVLAMLPSAFFCCHMLIMMRS